MTVRPRRIEMPERRGVLLTGATGFLGQYLLRDLLRQAYPVAVLVRDAPPQTASERIDCLVQFWSDRLGQELPTPTVVTGDLGQEDLGLDGADRRWLGVNCQRLIHAAASLSFRPTPDGEPWRTNLRGTQALLALSREIGLTEWHHVSS